MQRLNLDALDSLAKSERKVNKRHSSGVSPKHEKAMRRYRGADRSVTLTGVIDPPVKNAAKTAFAAQKPRLATDTPVKGTGKIIHVPSVYGL
jgi:hypothetical protein